MKFVGQGVKKLEPEQPDSQTDRQTDRRTDRQTHVTVNITFPLLRLVKKRNINVRLHMLYACFI